MSSASRVMKGYLPIALALRILVTSVAPSAILTIMVATMTLASSDLKVIVISYFFFGPRVPEQFSIKLQMEKRNGAVNCLSRFEIEPTLSNIDSEILAI